MPGGTGSGGDWFRVWVSVFCCKKKEDCGKIRDGGDDDLLSFVSGTLVGGSPVG